MRVTADRDDPGFRLDLLRCKVFLDGAELRDCMVADEEEGYVAVLLRDAQGNIVIRSGLIQWEVKRGTVRIELPAGLFRPSWPA